MNNHILPSIHSFSASLPPTWGLSCGSSLRIAQMTLSLATWSLAASSSSSRETQGPRQLTDISESFAFSLRSISSTESLPNDQTPHPIAKEEPTQLSKEARCQFFYLRSHSFSRYSKLVAIE